MKVEGYEPKEPRAACNYCGKDYTYDTKRNGTSTLSTIWIQVTTAL